MVATKIVFGSFSEDGKFSVFFCVRRKIESKNFNFFPHQIWLCCIVIISDKKKMMRGMRQYTNNVELRWYFRLWSELEDVEHKRLLSLHNIFLRRCGYSFSFGWLVLHFGLWNMQIFFSLAFTNVVTM